MTSDARRRSRTRMTVILGLLPALDPFSLHQKVPSSELSTLRPTHSGDGTVGCTSCSPLVQVPKFDEWLNASGLLEEVRKYQSNKARVVPRGQQVNPLQPVHDLQVNRSLTHMVPEACGCAQKLHGRVLIDLRTQTLSVVNQQVASCHSASCASEA